SVNTRAYGLAYQPDGKILVSGECGSVPCAVRYLSTGVLDASFAGGGIAGGSASVQSGGGGALALSFDGSFIVAGWSNPAPGITSRNVRRFAADAGGSGVGFTQVPIGFASSNPLGWSAVALQRDGKILVASSTFGAAAGNDFVVARYHGFPSAARNCSMDVDGDGRVIATIDGLLLTRAMLGFTGVALINGITFAAHASRTTERDIREYLVGQCGMSIQ
ncbi:MAG: hypothetical protein ABIZ64_17990, partial [Casimicrobium sp.]